MGRLLIIDGHAYAYRAFYAIRELRSPGGESTNAIFGFIKMMEKMVAGLQPKFVAVVWDGGLSTERVALMPEYKAQRPAMPVELSRQFDEINRYLSASGYTALCEDGIEADDLIASLARRAERAGTKVVIASPDKDFMQLVSPQIGLLNPGDKTAAIWEASHVRTKTGVGPDQIVDWLSLMGDAVDNIPGVPGVGPKTAAALLAQFGSVQRLYERLTEVAQEKLRQSLEQAGEAVRKNVSMVRLRDDLPCEFVPAVFGFKNRDLNQLRKLYQNWGFKGMLTALGDVPAESQPTLI